VSPSHALISLTPLPVFPEDLPYRYNQAQPCLVSVGNQSWATRLVMDMAAGCDGKTTEVFSENMGDPPWQSE